MIIGIVTSLFFGGIAFLLLHPKKDKKEYPAPNVTEPISNIVEPIPNIVEPIPKVVSEKYPLETPQETLNEMRQVREYIHADRIIEIIQESYSLCQNTANLKTFENRLELATRNAYTLKQMEQANLYNANPSSEYFLDLLIGNRSNLVNSFLKRAFNSNLSKAKSELKTQSGIRKRMDKFFSEIEDSILDFDEDLLLSLKNKV